MALNQLVTLALRKALTKAVQTGVQQGKAALVKRADETGITRDLGQTPGTPLQAPSLATAEDRQAAVRNLGRATGKLMRLGRDLNR